MGWQIAVDPVDRGLQVHYADAPLTSVSNDDKFCKAVRYQQTDSVAPPQASPATHSAKEALCGTSAYNTSSGCPFAMGTTAFPLGRQQWAWVLFSDESRFNLSHNDSRIWVFRRRGERFADKCHTERPRPSGSVVSVLDSWHCGCEFDPRLTQLFFPAYFHLSPLQKHVRKVVGGFGKKSWVSTCVRKPGNTYASSTAMIWP